MEKHDQDEQQGLVVVRRPLSWVTRNTWIFILLTMSVLLLCVPHWVSPPPPLLRTTAFQTPVILVPGDGGSALDVRLDKPKSSSSSWWCTKSTRGQWKRLWLDVTQLLPGNVGCFSDNMRLRYDDQDGTPQNAPGVEIRAVPGLEGLNVIKGSKKSNVYAVMVERLEQLAVPVWAATYDFRLSPRGNPQFLMDLEKQIEKRGKVTLICHSLGCLNVHYFLTRFVNDVDWKERHIHAVVMISPALGGAPSDLLQILTGDTVGVKWLRPSDVREEQRSDETGLWLLPDPHMYHQDEVLVTVLNGKNYTAHDYEELFYDADFGDGPTIYQRVCNLTAWDKTSRLEDPGVLVFSVHGDGVPTPTRYVYANRSKKNPFLTPPKLTITSTSGDGTVPKRGLEAGKNWKGSKKPLVLPNTDHNGVLSHAETLSLLEAIVTTPDL